MLHLQVEQWLQELQLAEDGAVLEKPGVAREAFGGIY
jgi:hypothetical protein